MNESSISKGIEKEIADWTDFLVSVGLTQYDRVYFPRNKMNIITFQNSNLFSSARNLYSYYDIYKQYLEKEIYNILTIDRAIIQIEYRFLNEQLIYHRLAFSPAPSLNIPWNTFETNLPDLDSELQQIDETLSHLYEDVTEQTVVRFPLRFDYDDRSKTDTDPFHPKVHLTLGEYSNCRIPVLTPLTPSIFFDFILRNFYHRTFRNAFLEHRNEIPKSDPNLSEFFAKISTTKTDNKTLYISVS